MIFVWTIGDVIGVAVFAIVLLVFGYVWACEKFKQWRCKHDGHISETRACDAICCKCGKNLGFIGSWRKREALK